MLQQSYQYFQCLLVVDQFHHLHRWILHAIFVLHVTREQVLYNYLYQYVCLFQLCHFSFAKESRRINWRK